VVLNACPVKRGQKEAPAVANARAWLEKNQIPVWSGQVSQRAGFVLSLSQGAGAAEDDARSLGAAEITKLWSAVEKSVEAVNTARTAAMPAGRAAKSMIPKVESGFRNMMLKYKVRL
jgi:chromosome partitioning protein